MTLKHLRRACALAVVGMCACGSDELSATSAQELAAAKHIVSYTGFSMPESVQYDAKFDRYLVSNINGMGPVKDNNGFISVLSPDGAVTELKWIEGGKNDVTLNAPTGSTIVNNVLFVADTPSVRMFDLETGKPLGAIEIPDVTVLNDLAADPDGKVYVTDSGFTIGPSGNPQPTGTDAIFVIENDQAELLVRSPDLHMPNGIEWTSDGLVVCATGAGEVYVLDAKGTKQRVTTTAPGGGLDGVVTAGNELLVTSHQASAVLRGKLNGTFEIAIPDQPSPANLAYDTKRNRILVPQVLDNTVDVFELR